jgi:hypothetical protein
LGLDDEGNSYYAVPAGLAGVTDVGAGFADHLVLKSDGTVVAWGMNIFQQSVVPAGLTGVVAIAKGGDHDLVLKADGTMVGWGYNLHGQATPPALANVVAISAGGFHSLALIDALTPVRAIGDLKAYLDAQLLKAATRNALVVKLNAALAALAVPNVPLACTRMQDVINLAKAQKGKKELTTAQANYLIAQATDIKLLIGCP